MGKILHLSAEKWKNMPYKSTIISKETTKGDIMGLLFKNGVEDYQWTRVKGQESLVFKLTVRIDNQDYELAFKYEPAMIYKETGRGHSKEWTLQEKQSWRMFYWLLKAKLEAVQFGLEEAYEVMASNIVNLLPDGTQVTVAEAIKSLLSTGNMDNLALEYIPPEEPEERRKVENENLHE